MIHSTHALPSSKMQHLDQTEVATTTTSTTSSSSMDNYIEKKMDKDILSISPSMSSKSCYPNMVRFIQTNNNTTKKKILKVDHRSDNVSVNYPPASTQEAAEILLQLRTFTPTVITSSSPPRSAVKRSRDSTIVHNDAQKQSEQHQQHEEERDEKGKRYGCQCAIRFQYEIQVSNQMKFVSCLKCLRARAQFYLGPRYYARGIKMRVKPDQMKEENRSTIVWGDIIHKYHLQNVFQCIEKHFVVKIPASVNNLHDTLLFLGNKFPCTFEELLKVSHVPIISCDPKNKISDPPMLVKEEIEEDDVEDVEPERKISRIGVHII